MLETSTKTPKDDIANFISIVASNATLFGAAIYTSGWVYLRHYYDFFEIDLSILELSWTDTLVYSISVVRFMIKKMLSWQAAALAFVATLLWFLVRSRFDLPSLNQQWQGLTLIGRAFATLFIAGVLSWLLFEVARSAGRESAVTTWRSPHLATELVFTKDCEPNELLKIDNDRGELFFLKATPKYFFLFRRNDDDTKKPVMAMRLYRIPTRCITHSVTRLRRPLR